MPGMRTRKEIEEYIKGNDIPYDKQGNLQIDKDLEKRHDNTVVTLSYGSDDNEDVERTLNQRGDSLYSCWWVSRPPVPNHVSFEG